MYFIFNICQFNLSQQKKLNVQTQSCTGLMGGVLRCMHIYRNKNRNKKMTSKGNTFASLWKNKVLVSRLLKLQHSSSGKLTMKTRDKTFTNLFHPFSSPVFPQWNVQIFNFTFSCHPLCKCWCRNTKTL